MLLKPTAAQGVANYIRNAIHIKELDERCLPPKEIFGRFRWAHEGLPAVGTYCTHVYDVMYVMYAPTPFGPTGDVMLFMYVMHAMVSLPLWESPSCGGEPWTLFCTCSRCPSLKSIQTRGANVVLDSRTVALDLRSVALASWVSVSLFCIRVLWLWIRGMGLLDSWIRALCLWVHVM